MPRSSFVKNEDDNKSTRSRKSSFSEEPVKVVEKDEVIEEIPVVKEKPVQKKVFEQSDGVMCRSICSGMLFIQGPKTGMIYQFADYDDETEIEYRDLVAMVRSKDKNVYEPRIVIEDEDFLHEFSAIEKFYADQFKTRDLKAILNMNDNDMADAIKKLPKGAYENIKSIAAFQIANGYIDSRRKIKALNEIFGVDFDLVGELMSN